MSVNDAPKQLWTKTEFETDGCLHWHIGNCSIYVEKKHDHWHIASSYQKKIRENPIVAVNSKPSNEIIWDQYYSGINDILQLLPILPNRPLILNPDVSIRILPKTEVLFYVNIPVWIQLYSGSNTKNNFLTEIPSVELSSSWFGEPDDGEATYSLPCMPSTEFSPDKILLHQALCPLKISNNSSLILDFQRLLLRVEQLYLYIGDDGLFTNEVFVNYKGSEQTSNISFAEKKPDFAGKLKKINNPRVADSKSLISRSYSIFKAFTQY